MRTSVICEPSTLGKIEVSIRLGLIGISPGNGHPYSWAAIFNGYNPGPMEECGYPVIPRYLEQQSFPDAAIREASVTHVWAQEREIAEHISKSALIPNVVEDFADMIGHIDGLLLARDDADMHPYFAAPFLDAGIPIYIDKPLAFAVDEAQRMINRQRYPGQIFSCSALKYANELTLTDEELAGLGRIRYVAATVPNDWDKYAIHAIDPILQLVAERGELVETRAVIDSGLSSLSATYSDDFHLRITAFGRIPAPISLTVFGEQGWKQVVFRDAFHAFKYALEDFVQGIRKQDIRTSPESMLRAIRLVEAGRVP
jgi:predicted dehydrogenase